MEKKIQVKGTLPLVAEYLGAEEKKIYSIFNLDLKEETEAVTENKKGARKNETANKGKAVRSPSNSI